MKYLKHIGINALGGGLLIAAALTCTSPVHAQMYPSPNQTGNQTFPGQSRDPRGIQGPAINNRGIENAAGGSGPEVAQRQMNSRNAERQRKLVEDTDKLLTLATQLKTDVDKTNKDILSVDVVKRAEEIEKLAKSVKERMKG